MKFRSIWKCGLLAILVVSCHPGHRPVADLVLKNGDFYTANRRQPRVQALAICGDRILAVGSNEEISLYEDESTRIVTLQGRFGCPGFNDAQVQLFRGGLSISELDLTGVRSTRDLQRRIYRTQRGLPPNDWLIGWGWDQNFLPGGQWPTRQMLDRVVRDIPIFLLRKCGQAALVNTRALTIANIHNETPAPFGGEIVKGRGTGNRTGILKGAAMDLIIPYIPPTSRDAKVQALETALDTLKRLGITSIQTVVFPEELNLIREVVETLEPACRITAWLPVDVDWEEAKRLRKTFSHPYIRLCGFGMRLDGSLGAASALFKEPYFDPTSNRGLSYWSSEELRQLIVDAHRQGFSINVQAVGSEANRMALDSFTIAQRFASDQPCRHRISYARALYPEDVSRVGSLGLVAVVQPSQIVDELEWVESILGTGRSRFVHAYRSLKNHGATLAFSTDWPVTQLNPMVGLYAAVSRQDISGLPVEGFHPRERISMEEALEAYTWGSAYAEGEDSQKGSLEPGKMADIVILNADPIVASVRDVREIKVVLTVLGGKIIYQASE